jgi:hypothetical protein
VLSSSAIVDADVSASAAIAGTKVSPAFGSQNGSTTGTWSTGAMTVTTLRVSTLGAGIGHYDASGNVTSSAIVNADISASAAIALTKLATGGAADGKIAIVAGGVITLGDDPDQATRNLQLYGDKRDGNLTVSTTNLTSGPLIGGVLVRDAFFDTLTMAAGSQIQTGGFRIYCYSLVLDNAPAGCIINNGNNGGAGITAGTGGGGGAQIGGLSVGGGLGGAVGGAGGTAAGACWRRGERGYERRPLRQRRDRRIWI